jgi:hypothetical protein
MEIETVKNVSVLPDFSQWVFAPIKWLFIHIPNAISFLKEILSFAVALSIPIFILSFIGIIYCLEKIKKIRAKEKELYEAKVENGFEIADSGDRAMAHRWNNATKHINSDNPNDWKQAIMEADIILDALLDKLGYRGESIGEKLKRVNPGDMKTLNEAWEAHKVRNQIAHEGSSFNLTHHDAKQTIANYRKVFDEFYIV